jgi:hypothetical protein
VVNILPFNSINDNDTLKQLYSGYHVLPQLKYSKGYQRAAFDQKIFLERAGSKEDDIKGAERSYSSLLAEFGYTERESFMKRLRSALRK